MWLNVSYFSAFEVDMIKLTSWT